MYWFRKAAEQGDSYAMTNLGTMHEHGEGVPKNTEVAIQFYLEAAGQGDSTAMFNLGLAKKK